MTNSMQGLRVKPTYGDLIHVAVSDGLENIKFPNRDSTFFKKWLCNVTIGWGRNENDGKTTRNCI